MIQYLPVIASLASTVFGAVKEGQQRKEMANTRAKWGAENESMFNTDYYQDYTRRADSQAFIKQMRDEMKKQNTVEQNTAAVTGATPDAVNAGKERRNKAITGLFSNMAARGQAWKDRSKDKYLNRKYQLQGLEYNDQNANAISANNLMYNGITGLASTDWAGIMGGYKPNQVAAPARIPGQMQGVAVNEVKIPDTMKTASSVFGA